MVTKYGAVAYVDDVTAVEGSVMFAHCSELFEQSVADPVNVAPGEAIDTLIEPAVMVWVLTVWAVHTA
jgi:hypothetical protein